MCLTDGITGFLTIGGQQRSIILDLDLILRMRHVQVSPDAHLVGEHLVETYLNLITFSFHLTQVGCRRRLTEVGRNGTFATLHQNVGTLVAEVLHRTGQQTT